MPLEVGNKWVYAFDPDEAVLEAAEPDLSDLTTYTRTVIEVGDTQATLECDGGAILTFPSLTLDLVLGGGEFSSADFRYGRGSGIFLPSIETLEANNWDYDWQTELLLSGEIRIVIDDTQEFVATMTESPFVFNWSTAGSGEDAFETIDVLAGEFEALKFDLTSEMIFNIDMAGSNFSAAFSTDESQWYAPGVGLLHTVSYSASMDLSGMSVPFDDETGDVSLMLIDFQSAGEQ